jgi:type II secretory pathway pseudopilin PulG
VKKFAVQSRVSESRTFSLLTVRRGPVSCSPDFSSPDFREHGSRQRNCNESGYMLLTLMLMVALMFIFATALVIPIKFTMQRDQETEMIHRGVQYSRAIRGYYKKFGRYPVKLEDLDNTNNLRYLRKHYKDPITGKDFKLLHYGDPDLALGGIGGGTIAGATPVSQMNGMNGGSSFGGSSFGGSSFGGSSFGNSSFGNSSFGNSNNGVNSNGVFSQSSGSSSMFGGNSNSQSSGSQNTSGQSGSNSSDSSSTQAGSGSAEQESSSSNSSSGSSSFGNQVFGGGPIVGVESTSKKATIREFNKKKKYNEWQFIYDPTADRGGLITTPYQPALASFGNSTINGATPAGSAGNSSSPFGNSSGSSFGQSGFGQSSFGSGFGSGQSSFGNSGSSNSSSSSSSSNSPQ